MSVYISKLLCVWLDDEMQVKSIGNYSIIGDDVREKHLMIEKTPEHARQ